MPHLVLALRFLAPVAGAASIFQAAMIRMRCRKLVVRHCTFFLPSIWFILFALPAFFLSLNRLSIAFGPRYLDRPAYCEGGKPAPYFLERFGITAREADEIALLPEGEAGKAIACIVGL